MNVPKRMPVWRSQDKIRTHWLSFLCLLDALYGFLTIFGKSEGAPQALLRRVWPFATPFWGALLFASAVLIYIGFSVSGAAISAVCWGILVTASVAVIITGDALSSAGWVVPFGMTGWHVLIIIDVGSGLDADRERRQRA